MSIYAKHVPYARETAICVDLALTAMEEDILTELAQASPLVQEALVRVLAKLRKRRELMTMFTSLTTKAA